VALSLYHYYLIIIANFAPVKLILIILIPYKYCVTLVDLKICSNNSAISDQIFLYILNWEKTLKKQDLARIKIFQKPEAQKILFW
jgi:hypothetical protein